MIGFGATAKQQGDMMSDPESYEVYAIQYGSRGGRSKGETFLSPILAADFHDVAQDITYYVWLITNENRTVLVDTGFGRDELARRRAVLGPGWRMDYARSPAEGVAMLGFDPKAITDVIVTHLHYDHAGTTGDFPNAAFHLQEVEMAYATGPIMCHEALRFPYTVDFVVDMVRHLYNGRVKFIAGDAEFAPGITLHLTAGHTMGMQSVRVLTKRGWVVLASDASHFYDNVEAMAPFPIVYNVGDMLDSLRKLQRLAQTPQHIVPGHDPLVLARYPAPSAALQGAVVRLDVAPKE
jgi:glyoxylase-like metal-dependent hydrolase (beta-lactamase superfamily II)